MMSNLTQYPTANQKKTGNGNGLIRPISSRRQLKLLKWFVPVGLILLVILYEVGPSSWIYGQFGFGYHLLIEIILFGTVGPILVFVLIELLGRWIDEKETADLQAELITKAQNKEAGIREIGDDTIQVLFATSLLLSTLKSRKDELPAETVAYIDATEQELNNTIIRLRSELME